MEDTNDIILQAILQESQGVQSLTESLINLLKVSAAWDYNANSLAGRLEHQKHRCHTTHNIKQYISEFQDILTNDVTKFLHNYNTELDALCREFEHSPDYDRLLGIGILSAKRFYDTYLLKNTSSNTYESPVHFFMRLAVFCTCETLKQDHLRKTLQDLADKHWGDEIRYDMDFVRYFFRPLATQLVCCSTPVMRSAGVRDANLASCFIMAPDMSTEESAREALYIELPELLASKSGVGIDVTRFSFEDKNITSCLKLINAQTEYYNDHSIRPVGVAAYLELWHTQCQEFLSAKLPENPDRCNSLFQGLCVPSLFFKMYKNDPTDTWYFFDSITGNQLNCSYGEEFEKEYFRLVEQKAYVGSLSVKSVMFSMINTIIKTGTPYIILKDACNRHHWCETQGCAINCANLCAEIIQQPRGATSTCNLVNICLPKCLKNPDNWSKYYKRGCDNDPSKGNNVVFSEEELRRATEVSVFVVNAVISGGMYPTEGVYIAQGERSMGIGVHGLADVFAELGYTYIDKESINLNIRIFELMYYWAVKTSHDIVFIGGGDPFRGWEKSKLSSGKFHWESWSNVKFMAVSEYEWNELRDEVYEHGVFNSQFLALMPTVGSSQLTGMSDSFYPFYANMTSKVSNKEEVMKPNLTFLKHVRDQDMGLVRLHSGDVCKFPPSQLLKYKRFISAFDYDPECYIKMARDRAPYIDNSQSMSLFLHEAHVKNASYLKNLLMLGYELGLKTIMYYCRIKKESRLSELECLNLKYISECQSDGDEEELRCCNKRPKSYTSDSQEECFSCQ